MARSDIQLFTPLSPEFGSKKHLVAAAASRAIYAGEPVYKVFGSAYVIAQATNKPTDNDSTGAFLGIAASDSTETTTATGYVEVIENRPGMSYLIAPTAAASWDTQAEYNALVGDRVLLDLTSSSWTILASDSQHNGCIVEYLDISLYPGKVAFSVKPSASFNGQANG